MLDQSKNKPERYWNNEIQKFKFIYTPKKNNFLNYPDNKYYREVYSRYDYIIKHSHPIKGKLILDIGCGTGIFAPEYKRQNTKKVVL